MVFALTYLRLTYLQPTYLRLTSRVERVLLTRRAVKFASKGISILKSALK
jgi:hypothetical protein